MAAVIMTVMVLQLASPVGAAPQSAAPPQTPQAEEQRAQREREEMRLSGMRESLRIHVDYATTLVELEGAFEAGVRQDRPTLEELKDARDSIASSASEVRARFATVEAIVGEIVRTYTPKDLAVAADIQARLEKAIASRTRVVPPAAGPAPTTGAASSAPLKPTPEQEQTVFRLTVYRFAAAVSLAGVVQRTISKPSVYKASRAYTDEEVAAARRDLDVRQAEMEAAFRRFQARLSASDIARREQLLDEAKFFRNESWARYRPGPEESPTPSVAPTPTPPRSLNVGELFVVALLVGLMTHKPMPKTDATGPESCTPFLEYWHYGSCELDFRTACYEASLVESMWGNCK